jgi:hypothetical protein
MTASCTPWGLHASPSRAVYTPEPQGLLAQEDDRQSAQSQQQQELDGGGGVGGAGGEDGAEQGGAQPVELHSVKVEGDRAGGGVRWEGWVMNENVAGRVMSESVRTVAGMVISRECHSSTP